MARAHLRRIRRRRERGTLVRAARECGSVFKLDADREPDARGRAGAAMGSGGRVQRAARGVSGGRGARMVRAQSRSGAQGAGQPDELFRRGLRAQRRPERFLAAADRAKSGAAYAVRGRTAPGAVPPAGTDSVLYRGPSAAADRRRARRARQRTIPGRDGAPALRRAGRTGDALGAVVSREHAALQGGVRGRDGGVAARRGNSRGPSRTRNRTRLRAYLRSARSEGSSRRRRNRRRARLLREQYPCTGNLVYAGAAARGRDQVLKRRARSVRAAGGGRGGAAGRARRARARVGVAVRAGRAGIFLSPRPHCLRERVWVRVRQKFLILTIEAPRREDWAVLERSLQNNR